MLHSKKFLVSNALLRQNYEKKLINVAIFYFFFVHLHQITINFKTISDEKGI